MGGSVRSQWRVTHLQGEKARGRGAIVSMLCVLSHFSRVQLCNPMDCSPPGSSIPGILQVRTGAGCCFLLQGIFPTQ